MFEQGRDACGYRLHFMAIGKVERYGDDGLGKVKQRFAA
jgi:hypothetical protein